MLYIWLGNFFQCIFNCQILKYNSKNMTATKPLKKQITPKTGISYHNEAAVRRALLEFFIYLSFMIVTTIRKLKFFLKFL